MTEVRSDVLGKTKDGNAVRRFTLENQKGLKVGLLEYGALISEICVPDKNGKSVDVCLGFDNMPDYEIASAYCPGAVCGRVANRIAKGQFTLDGRTYSLCVNDPAGCLHGGKVGFHKKLWKGEVKDNKVTMTYVSPDGEENFPGELTTKVIYSLGDDDNSLKLEYEATTTKPTIVNLTSHSYFNLAGHEDGDIKDQVITVKADDYLAKDDTGIPTVPSGEIRDVTNTVFDLRAPTPFGKCMHKIPGGISFDHSFDLKNNGQLVLAARVEHPTSGQVMECYTTQPSIHLYTSHFLPTSTGKGGAKYGQYGFFCLEAQHHPDSINHANFPSTILRPGETYRQTTIYKFGLQA